MARSDGVPPRQCSVGVALAKLAIALAKLTIALAAIELRRSAFLIVPMTEQSADRVPYGWCCACNRRYEGEPHCTTYTAAKLQMAPTSTQYKYCSAQCYAVKMQRAHDAISEPRQEDWHVAAYHCCMCDRRVYEPLGIRQVITAEQSGVDEELVYAYCGEECRHAAVQTTTQLIKLLPL